MRLLLLTLALALVASVQAQTNTFYNWETTWGDTTGSEPASAPSWGGVDGTPPYPFGFLSLSGATVYTLGDDDFTAPIPLQFTFTLNGVDYTSARISSNGYLSLSTANTATFSPYVPVPIPTPDAYISNLNPIIAPLWIDLYPPGNPGSVIQSITFGRFGEGKFCVQWLGVQYFGDRSRQVNVQVILLEGTNEVQVNFGQVDLLPAGYQYEIGLSGPGGSAGCTYLDVPYTPDYTFDYSNQAILFEPFSGVIGDPQFAGLQGQQYQVHGYAGEVFNLVSAPQFSFNAKFVYISTGTCTYNNTACWTHPGTYLDDLGFVVGRDKIRAVAGTHSEGLQLWLNDAPVIAAPGKLAYKSADESTFLAHPSNDRFVLRTPLFQVEVTNSDHFFNLRVMLLDEDLLHAGATPLVLRHASAEPAELTAVYPSAPIHGLIGQTWRNVRYAEGRAYEGAVEDYMIQSQNVFDPVFPYSQFHHAPAPIVILP